MQEEGKSICRFLRVSFPYYLLFKKIHCGAAEAGVTLYFREWTCLYCAIEGTPPFKRVLWPIPTCVQRRSIQRMFGNIGRVCNFFCASSKTTETECISRTIVVVLPQTHRLRLTELLKVHNYRENTLAFFFSHKCSFLSSHFLKNNFLTDYKPYLCSERR